jgi:hypothetical protein
MATPPFFSVVVIFHSRVEFLRHSIGSVLSQTLDQGRFEVILVGPSRPPFLEESAFKTKVHFVGSSAAGIGGKIADVAEQCSGDIVTFLEDDDIYRADRLERVDVAFREGRLTYLQNGYAPINELGVPRFGHFPHQSKMEQWKRLGPITLTGRPSGAELRILRRIPAGFNNSSISIRRSVLDDGWDLLRRVDLLADITLLYLGLTHPGHLRFDPDPWTSLRVHSQSLSNPTGLTLGLAMERLSEFSLRTRAGTGELLAYARKVGPEPVAREVEGQSAILDLIFQLRSPLADSRACARAWIKSLSRLDTFEVLSRAGALPLGAVASVMPSVGHSLYSQLWRLGIKYFGSGG